MRLDQLIIEALGDMTMAVDETTASILGITLAKPAYGPTMHIGKPSCARFTAASQPLNLERSDLP